MVTRQQFRLTGDRINNDTFLAKLVCTHDEMSYKRSDMDDNNLIVCDTNRLAWILDSEIAASFFQFNEQRQLS